MTERLTDEQVAGALAKARDEVDTPLATPGHCRGCLMALAFIQVSADLSAAKAALAAIADTHGAVAAYRMRERARRALEVK